MTAAPDPAAWAASTDNPNRTTPVDLDSTLVGPVTERDRVVPVSAADQARVAVVRVKAAAGDLGGIMAPVSPLMAVFTAMVPVDRAGVAVWAADRDIAVAAQVTAMVLVDRAGVAVWAVDRDIAVVAQVTAMGQVRPDMAVTSVAAAAPAPDPGGPATAQATPDMANPDPCKRVTPF